MSDSIDNYTEETAPLFKLLSTPAFRFIIVCYNHYDLLRRLEQDLRQRFPERPFLKLDTAKSTYPQISEALQSMDSGFFWLENFDDALKEERNSLGKETEEMARRNENRRHITAGLNLRRDRWAKSPIALFVFVPMTSNELFARSIMEKMPDLWSFRSLILELRQARSAATVAQTDRRETTPSFSTLGGSTEAEKTNELHRLLGQLEQTPLGETDYLLTLYPQIVELQTELGHYNQALSTLSDWERIAPESTLATIYEKRGELFNDSGDVAGALTAFQQALEGYEQAGDKENEAWMQIRIGDTYEALGNLDKAIKHFTTALRVSETESDNPVFRNLQGLANERMGDSWMALGQVQNALSAYEAYQKIEQELWESNLSESQWKNNLAGSYEKLGTAHSDLGDLQQALGFYEQYNRLEKELHEAFPQNVEFKNSLAISYEKLGEAHAAFGDLQQALGFYEKDIELTKELHEAFPQNVEFKNSLAISYEKFGDIHAALGDLQQALGFYEQHKQLTKELHEAFPQNVEFKNGLAISYSKLGKIHAALGNQQQALGFYEQYNQLEKELHETFPQNVYFKNNLAISYSFLGNTYDDLGDLQQALEFYEKDLQLSKDLYNGHPQNVEFHNNLATSYTNLGETHVALGDQQQALEYYKKGLELSKSLHETFPQNVEFKNNLAVSYLQLGVFNRDQKINKEKAKEYFEQCFKLLKELSKAYPSYVEFQKNFHEVKEALDSL